MMNVGFLDLSLLSTGAVGVQKVAMPLYHTRDFQQAGDTEY